MEKQLGFIINPIFFIAVAELKILYPLYYFTKKNFHII